MKTAIIFLSTLLLTGFNEMPPTDATQMYMFAYENVLGTSLDLKIAATSPRVAEHAEEVALAEIDRLDNILSSYKPDSEFSRWQKTQGVDVLVSPELFEVLSLFQGWKVRTGGALNASAGVAVALWKRAADIQVIPTNEELANAVTLMNQTHWTLNSSAQTAKHFSDDPLLLNSFVKSYIIDKTVKKIMMTPGVTGCVLNIGGDIVVSGEVEESVRVMDPYAPAENAQPFSMLKLTNTAIATSGNYQRGYLINNKWYSHILDARTALPVSEVISASVIAPDPGNAGALATAFNILTPEESAALANEIPGVCYQIVTRAGQRIENEGWQALLEKAAQEGSSVSKSNGQYELKIELELARFEGRFRRPFVAVWVEDADKQSVRTLALWYNKPRWLPDLKRWYSKNRDNLYQSSGAITSISGATRSPGRYTLLWNGENDEGKMVPSGKYTVYIEAAREHGTYQLIRQDIDWNGKAKHLQLQGGVEITAASIDYQPVSNN